MYINRWILLSIITYIIMCIFLYMCASTLFISIIFRLINFAALIGLGVFLFCRKFYSSTKEMIHQEELKKESLITRRDELITEEEQLHQKLERQDQECRYLLEKIDQWRASFDDHQQQYEMKRKLSHMRAQEKAQKQSEALGRDLIYGQVLHQTGELMRQDLQKRFADQSQQKEFIQQLVNFMRKKVS